MFEIQKYFIIFIIYSMIGWVIEGIETYPQYKRFYNRGFLIGPYCPIYGVGSVLMTILLERYYDDWFVVFIMAILICSILEYVTSWIMEKMFHARWWDYSDEKFNINGRINLRNSVLFGIGGLIIIYVTNPSIFYTLNHISIRFVHVITGIMAGLIMSDTIVSMRIMFKIKSIVKKVVKDSSLEIRTKIMNIIKEKSYPIRRMIMAFPQYAPKVATKVTNKIKTMSGAAIEKIKPKK